MKGWNLHPDLAGTSTRGTLYVTAGGGNKLPQPETLATSREGRGTADKHFVAEVAKTFGSLHQIAESLRDFRYGKPLGQNA